MYKSELTELRRGAPCTEELPEAGIVVDEATQIGYLNWFAMPAYHPRTLIWPSYQGRLCWGFPTSVAVHLGGGFKFNMQELPTTVQHDIGAVALVFEYERYGNPRAMQNDYFGGRPFFCGPQNPDFWKLTKTLWAQGIETTRPAE